ncbi:vWA domain-containing protein [Ornithinimicrobium flavum]|uniref:vWA domain-containing protein n=1 Tax=Ornithinimicrobium flavum TaxID=1288636 RepID=UPI00106FE890|nr:VWA domain-containing protein [Ornithinimicrobium flavum]
MVRTTLPRIRALALATAGLLLALPLSATATTLPASGTTAIDTAATSATDDAATPEPDGDAQLLLLLDASGSMADPDATGEPKIGAARSALHEVIDDLGSDQQVGLRVFGGSVAPDQPTEAKCTDSQLVVPIGSDNAQALGAAVDDYAPLGETPIAHALQQAADDLGPDGNRTIVLVSDGIATCDPDPCEIAEQLSADGLDLVVHTVGLGADDQTRTQLQCIADAAGGTYYDAADTDTLTTALTRISTRAFRPFEFGGTPVEGSYDKDTAPVLAEGRYLDTFPDPDSGDAKWYRVERTVPNSTVRVGATMRPNGDVSTGTFNLRLDTETVNLCDHRNALVWTSNGGNGFGAPRLGVRERRAAGVRHRRGRPRAHLPVLQAALLADQTIELVITEEPPIDGASPLPEPDTSASFEGPDLGEPEQTLVGGTSFAAAVPIQPGVTYAADILPGEVLVYRIPVGWGQRLEAVAEFPQPDGQLAEHMKRELHPADLHLFGPDRGNVTEPNDTAGTSSRAIAVWNDTVRATATTAEVRYWNRLEGVNGGAADRAGDYYVTVGLSSSIDVDAVPQPFTFTVQVVGEPHGEPTYLASDAADRAATTSDADGRDAGVGTTEANVGDTGSTGAATPADVGQAPDGGPDPEVTPSDGADRGWLPWALGGGGVLAAGAGIVLLATRRGPTA